MMGTTPSSPPALGALPSPDRDSRPYFAALAEGRFELQQCESCGSWSWPPRPICSGCHGMDLVWHPVSGRGTVVSWVTTHHAYVPVLASMVPYTTALVQIDEQPDIFIPGRLLGEIAPQPGLRVHAVPERQTDEIGLLLWEPV